MTEAEWLTCQDAGKMLHLFIVSQWKWRLVADHFLQISPLPADYSGRPYWWLLRWAQEMRSQSTWKVQSSFCCRLLRDIFGNPFRPVRLLWHGDLKPDWLTDEAHALAEEAYHQTAPCPDPICRGRGRWTDGAGSSDYCGECQGSGLATDGRLDPVSLHVLADCLEDLFVSLGQKPPSLCATCQGKGFVVEYEEVQGSANPITVDCSRCPGELLACLRSPGPHYRGFWVLDLLLGYS